MKVLLTIDVETYSGDYEGDVNAGGAGLPFILDQLDEHGLRATFFVEALGALRWGEHGIQNICAQINQRSHEIQLHLHPEVAVPEGIGPARSHMHSFSRNDQEVLMINGLRILHECGVDSIVSFRAGDLAANADTIKAMANVGLCISSNRDMDTKSSISSHINQLFPIVNDISMYRDVIDLPVSTMRSYLPFDGKYRHLNLTAVSYKEMESSIVKMLNSGYRCCTILTHPQEFYYNVNGKIFKNLKNCRRLQKLLTFIANKSELSVMTVSECNRKDVPLIMPPELNLNVYFSYFRLITQGLHRALMLIHKLNFRKN